MLGSKIDEKLLEIMWEESERLKVNSKEIYNDTNDEVQHENGVVNEEMSEKQIFAEKLSVEENHAKIKLPSHWNDIKTILSSFQSGFKSAMGSSHSQFTLIFELSELSYLFCGSLKQKQKRFDPLEFSTLLSFQGHNISKNKEYFMNNLLQKTKKEIQQFTKVVTGSTTIDDLKKGKLITIKFIQPNNYRGNDIIIHTCSSTVECLSCPSQEIMDILFVAYFSFGNDIFGIG